MTRERGASAARARARALAPCRGASRRPARAARSRRRPARRIGASGTIRPRRLRRAAKAPLGRAGPRPGARRARRPWRTPGRARASGDDARRSGCQREAHRSGFALPGRRHRSRRVGAAPRLMTNDVYLPMKPRLGDPQLEPRARRQRALEQPQPARTRRGGERLPRTPAAATAHRDRHAARGADREQRDCAPSAVSMPLIRTTGNGRSETRRGGRRGLQDRRGDRHGRRSGRRGVEDSPGPRASARESRSAWPWASGGSPGSGSASARRGGKRRQGRRRSGPSASRRSRSCC